MSPSVDLAGDQLRIREGGGCLSVFGLPFFGAGIFLFLIMVGVVPLSNAGTMPFYGWLFVALMSLVFTAVGGGLFFGRNWTTVDRAHRHVRRQWGLLIPMREEVLPYHGATAVSLRFAQGDSDSADQYPVGLALADGTNLPLCDFTGYGEARACARAVAEHLGLDLEDASSDHPVRIPANQVDLSFRQRWRPLREFAVAPPPNGRCHVHSDEGETTVVIPSSRPHLLAILAGLAPAAVPIFFGPPLADFFRQTDTPPLVAWAFLGFLALAFGVVPAMTVINALRRAEVGATIVTVSAHRIRIQQRGAWRTRTTATLDAADILDVDFSVRESAVAATRRATEREVHRLRPSSEAAAGPRVERMLAVLGRLITSRGILVKTRTDIVTFGQGLDDDEIRYLHDVVRRALVGQASEP